MSNQVILTQSDVLAIIAKFIRFPNATMCKHYAACTLLSALESNGMHVSAELAKAIVDADDDSALELLKDMADVMVCSTGYRKL